MADLFDGRRINENSDAQTHLLKMDFFLNVLYLTIAQRKNIMIILGKANFFTSLKKII